MAARGVDVRGRVVPAFITQLYHCCSFRCFFLANGRVISFSGISLETQVAAQCQVDAITVSASEVDKRVYGQGEGKG